MCCLERNMFAYCFGTVVTKTISRMTYGKVVEITFFTALTVKFDYHAINIKNIVHFKGNNASEMS